MLWHTGDVYNAVDKVKILKKYLIVFIRDENTSNIYMNMLENSADLHEILKNYICLNLLKDTPEYQQFSDVFSVEQIPSIFIISHLGELIDIIKDQFTELDLCTKFKQIFGLEVSDVENRSEESLSLTSNQTGNTTEERVPVDKMEEVRKLLAEKHKKREEEEKQKEKDDELKRRDLGKQLNMLKQNQKEREENDIKAEIKRKRAEEKEAREKILRQIEEDKLERKQKFANQTSKIGHEGVETIITNRHISTDSVVRLQFRFPDGSSVNNTFRADDNFSVVRKFVAEHIKNNMGNFNSFEIKQFFPKQTISEDQDSCTLLDLNLTPSASLIVIFLSKPKAINQATSIMSLALAPLNFFYMTIISFIQWLIQKYTGRGGGVGADRVQEHRTHDRTVEPSVLQSWEERQKRLLAAQSRTIKTQGNVAGFSDAPKKDDNEDDEARWNGNSTQQM